MRWSIDKKTFLNVWKVLKISRIARIVRLFVIHPVLSSKQSLNAHLTEIFSVAFQTLACEFNMISALNCASRM